MAKLRQLSRETDARKMLNSRESAMTKDVLPSVSHTCVKANPVLTVQVEDTSQTLTGEEKRKKKEKKKETSNSCKKQEITEKEILKDNSLRVLYHICSVAESRRFFLLLLLVQPRRGT